MPKHNYSYVLCQGALCYKFLMLSDKSRRTICSEVAKSLHGERIRRGLTLAAVAAKAGLSYQMIGFVEKEKRNPTLDTLLRIADALEIDLPKILECAIGSLD